MRPGFAPAKMQTDNPEYGGRRRTIPSRIAGIPYNDLSWAENRNPFVVAANAIAAEIGNGEPVCYTPRLDKMTPQQRYMRNVAVMKACAEADVDGAMQDTKGRTVYEIMMGSDYKAFMRQPTVSPSAKQDLFPLEPEDVFVSSMTAG